MTISALVAVLSVGAIPAPTNAGVYACPDMTGPGGLPDTHVDGSDLSAFAAAKAVLSMTADFNTDNVVDEVDQEIFESVFGQSNFSCEAFWGRLHSGTPMCIDMVLDGNINASDLSAFAAAKGSNNMNGDFSGDGEVNDIDQTMLAMHLGETNYLCPGAAFAQYTDPIPPLPPVEQTNTEEPSQVPGESIVVLPVEETTSIPVLSTDAVVPPATSNTVDVIVPEVQQADVTAQATLTPLTQTSGVVAVDTIVRGRQKKNRVVVEPTVCLDCSRTYAPPSQPIRIPENPTTTAAIDDVVRIQIAGGPSICLSTPVVPVPIDSAKLPFFGLSIPGLILGGLSLRRKLKV